jgi:spore coat protein U-like protein
MYRAITAVSAVLAVGLLLVLLRTPVRAAPLSCSVWTQGFALSDYDVFAPMDTTTILSNAVQYTCNKNSTAVSIALGPSSGTNDYAPRQMLQNAGDALLYYVSLGGFTPLCGGGSGMVWGDSSLNNGTTSYLAVTGRRDTTYSVPAFGCMPHGQNVAGGLHLDSLQLLVSF